jgi:2-succinyl-5-enolpyruvyl-6-hydroxy-3-cyclohexene-1-carboxylate synthase
MEKLYTDEKNAQVVMSLLKQHGISKVIASPGTTNMALVASMQQDSFFEMYSAVDERSAAYMACGMAYESGEPVVISCTGATASRNYMPGMTEAFYRKLPILAVTSTQNVARVGHHVSQVIDRSQIPNDVAKLSLTLPIVKDGEDLWECEIKVNQAILELRKNGGGPVHLNLQTTYSRCFDVETLPSYRFLNRFDTPERLPELPYGNIGILVCSHKKWTEHETAVIEQFCEKTGAVVFCDHTSGYFGKNRILSSLLTGQQYINRSLYCPDLLIHIGEITGDSYTIRAARNKVWRVNEDGIVRDPFKSLEYVFEMAECDFFDYYVKNASTRKNNYYEQCKEIDDAIRVKIPEVPFSNVWLASKISNMIPLVQLFTSEF